MPGSGWNSNTVTTGPGCMPVTMPLILNSDSFCPIFSLMSSSWARSTLACWPGGSKSRRGGSVSRSAREGRGGSGGSGGSGLIGVGSVSGRGAWMLSRPKRSLAIWARTRGGLGVGGGGALASTFVRKGAVGSVPRSTGPVAGSGWASITTEAASRFREWMGGSSSSGSTGGWFRFASAVSISAFSRASR